MGREVGPAAMRNVNFELPKGKQFPGEYILGPEIGNTDWLVVDHEGAPLCVSLSLSRKRADSKYTTSHDVIIRHAFRLCDLCSDLL